MAGQQKVSKGKGRRQSKYRQRVHTFKVLTEAGHRTTERLQGIMPVGLKRVLDPVTGQVRVRGCKAGKSRRAVR